MSTTNTPQPTQRALGGCRADLVGLLGDLRDHDRADGHGKGDADGGDQHPLHASPRSESGPVTRARSHAKKAQTYAISGE